MNRLVANIDESGADAPSRRRAGMRPVRFGLASMVTVPGASLLALAALAALLSSVSVQAAGSAASDLGLTMPSSVLPSSARQDGAFVVAGKFGKFGKIVRSVTPRHGRSNDGKDGDGESDEASSDTSAPLANDEVKQDKAVDRAPPQAPVAAATATPPPALSHVAKQAAATVPPVATALECIAGCSRPRSAQHAASPKSASGEPTPRKSPPAASAPATTVAIAPAPAVVTCVAGCSSPQLPRTAPTRAADFDMAAAKAALKPTASEGTDRILVRRGNSRAKTYTVPQ